MQELQGNKVAPLSVFISYAHEDELLCQQLERRSSNGKLTTLKKEWLAQGK